MKARGRKEFLKITAQRLELCARLLRTSPFALLPLIPPRGQIVILDARIVANGPVARRPDPESVLDGKRSQLAQRSERNPEYLAHALSALDHCVVGFVDGLISSGQLSHD